MPVETVTDDNSAAEGRGGRAGGHEVTADGTEKEEEGSGSEEASAFLGGSSFNDETTQTVRDPPPLKGGPARTT
jgi:hypothetical protein